ncbi:MAG: response regulator [Pseudomonadota bacterium]
MLSGLTVLLAEDNPTNQIVAAGMLTNLGAQVEIANDGIEALERCSKKHFDMLVVDMDMPRLSGAALIATLRRESSIYRDTPILVLTAYLTEADIALAERSGADGFIAKPLVSIERFGADIERILATTDRSLASRAKTGSAAAAAEIGQPILDPTIMQGVAAVIGADRARTLIRRALADLPAEVQVLCDAMAAGDAEGAERQGHRLAGMAGAVGAMRLGALGRRIQDEGLAAVPVEVLQALWIATEEALNALLSDGL